MGSTVPLQDLNVYPDPLQTTTNSIAGVKLLTLNLNPSKNLWTKRHLPISDKKTDDQNALYSEYFRISELFRSSFAKKLQKYGDFEVPDPDSRAIVRVPEEPQPSSEVTAANASNPDQSLSVVVSRRKAGRSNELVRVTNLGMEDEMYFRNVVRRTRMMYDSIRILATTEEGRGRLCMMGLHGQVQAGIDYLPGSQSSNGEPIATSIIVSGGYEDDQVAGDTIIYTGHGGQDKFSRQCMHQKLEGGNLALERSMYHGIESGFGVYKYRLSRLDGQPEMGSSVIRFAESLRTRPLSARTTGYLTLDTSMRKEKVPVFLSNDIDGDHDPMYYDYLVNTVFPPYAFSQASNGKPVIFECGNFCQCPPTCRNRVSQHGLRNRLEIFRSRETGWGVRSLVLIQAGAFICEYTGVVLTREQAQIFSMNGDTLIYPNRFSERWTEWGDLSQIFSEYVHPSNPSIPPLDFAMDVSRMRNVACYISHSFRPNILVQYVLFDHNNLMFPHLMLFAMENIPPMRELSIDYGMADEWTGKLSICN
ncbi:flavin-containing monooxygenase YUCCA3-like [Hibiscus syriacus]|uniref:Flavin-containing monooxygenase YUCCA3-like n=1 Tax=Hibiscus syriacus TaxID=106335 RepID=A0A6A2ZAB7_HIBSY|nr:flavin-containing monooxygenase YUCCA3-like [Hibiscus syriacus]